MRTVIRPIGIAVAIVGGLGVAAHAQDGKNPPGVNPTHYQCYRVEAPTEPIVVKLLQDQFGIAEEVKIGTPLHLCAPTAKNRVAARDRVTHYLCYQDEVKPANKKVNIINQFTKKTGIDLAVLGPAFLCVPSRKKVLQ